MQVALDHVCNYNCSGKHKNNVQHKQVGSSVKQLINWNVNEFKMCSLQCNQPQVHSKLYQTLFCQSSMN